MKPATKNPLKKSNILFLVLLIGGIVLGGYVSYEYSIFHLRAKMAEVFWLVGDVRKKIISRYEQHRTLPTDIDQLGLPPVGKTIERLTLRTTPTGVTLTFVLPGGNCKIFGYAFPCIRQGAIFTDSVSIRGDGLTWVCRRGSIDARFMPPTCR